MTMLDVDDLPRAPWGVSAAYLYILDLDGRALAWEYLRRHPQYRADWIGGRSTSFERWGLRRRGRSTPRRTRSAAAVEHAH